MRPHRRSARHHPASGPILYGPCKISEDLATCNLMPSTQPSSLYTNQTPSYQSPGIGVGKDAKILMNDMRRAKCNVRRH